MKICFKFRDVENAKRLGFEKENIETQTCKIALSCLC